MNRRWRGLLDDATAATAIEYSLIAALVAMAIVSAVTALGGETTGLWQTVDERMSDAMAEAAP